MSKLLDDSEVIFDRQLSRECWRNGTGRLSTEPTQRGGVVGGHGEQRNSDPEQPRTTEFDRPADEGLGATSEGLREPHRIEGHQPLGPGDLPERRKDTGGRNRPHNEWSPVTALEDTVSHMQRELNVLQTENRFLRTPRAPVPVPLVRQAALTTTQVPLFNGSTCWEQYLQVFDAIVLSNGWGDATAAWQLLSHLQDDALNVALLIPVPLQATRKELTDALSSHYGSPGRLAIYRREFDKTVRKRGEDPSNFAITLETLAAKAFDDIGQEARLRLIRDRFIAGHESCDLRRYLDCVPPDTPLEQCQKINRKARRMPATSYSES